MNGVARGLGILFGYLTLALGVIVTGETVARKLFSVSLQGADELGGYILAFTSCLSFAVALIGRYHMRIDLIHYRLPVGGQAVLNWIGSVSIALFALTLAWAGYGVVRDTFVYNSTAPTPWATPLKYPQALWYAALAGFAIVAVILAARATRLLLGGRLKELADEFQPKALQEELREEVQDALARGAAR